ncbi:phospholipid carrier-dependent glycosyltransferase [Actinoallomurus iriomotensis]|uniref:phospholipid carrier-dependent glycosyltransferase n=1 Tax=Actinoallomurus iriomotensis TaxID=478107 RepID=UPI002555B375|nr:phospholipid carrier-dependent glycosyltransferase [Actinoallomurus iriomotensis]
MVGRVPADWWGSHRGFACVLAAAALLRVVALVAFPPLWFNDSFDYTRIGLHPFPHPLRPDGYGFFLWFLRPFRSFVLVVAVQHLMGLAMGVMVYALVRRRYGRARWVACLAAAPVLFDAYQVQLEQLVMSDVLFMFLSLSAVTVALWRRRPTWRAGIASGLLLALAGLTRTVGLPLVALLVVFLLVRRAGWRTVVAVAGAAALPVAAYALWFQSATGHFAITNVDGVFLWGRTAAFADCSKIKPPPDLAMMCPRRPVGEREASSSQIWEKGSPVASLDDAANVRGRRFALAAIEAQPWDYAVTVGDGLKLTFGWTRHDYPKHSVSRLYEFPVDTRTQPGYPLMQGKESTAVIAYAGPGPTGSIHGPYAGWLRTYQGWIFVRGPVLAFILLLGLTALRRRERLDAALAWSVAAGLLMVPLLTADFDYRYILPATPIACVAAALATRRTRPSEAGEGESSAGQRARVPAEPR